MKFSYAKSIPAITIWILAALPFTVLAQQRAYFHALDCRDSPAGHICKGGAPVHMLYAPGPNYTKEARKANVKGTVVVEGTLGLDGCLREVKVLRALGYGLDRSAIEAVQRWRFEALLKNGMPAETNVEGEVNFDPDWSPNSSLSNERRCGEK